MPAPDRLNCEATYSYSCQKDSDDCFTDNDCATNQSCTAIIEGRTCVSSCAPH